VNWMAIGMCLFGSLGRVVKFETRRSLRLLAPVVAALALGAAGWLAVKDTTRAEVPILSVPLMDAVRSLHSQTRAFLKRKGDPRVVVRVLAGTWPPAAGVMLERARDRYPAAVDPCFSYITGYRGRPNWPEHASLIFCDAHWANTVASQSRCEFIGERDDTFAYYMPHNSREPTRGFAFSSVEAFSYLRDGFTVNGIIAPAFGLWSEGTKSTIGAPLEPNRRCRVRLTAAPFVVPGKGQTVQLVLNGKPVGNPAALTSDQWQLCCWDLPAETVRSLNEITFVYGYAEPPIRVIADSFDIAPRALRLRDISFEQYGDVTGGRPVLWAGVGDVNGDGRAERLCCDRQGTWWVETHPNSEQRWGAWSTDVKWLNVQVADINGDGKADVIGRTDGGAWWAGVSDGSKFVNQCMSAWSADVKWVGVKAIDVNGDGKDDVIGRAGNGHWWAGISDGTRFVTHHVGPHPPAVKPR